jgi:hypothetical protein
MASQLLHWRAGFGNVEATDRDVFQIIDTVIDDPQNV